MDFKDMIKADVKNVFLNLSEFAEEHTINGSTIRAVVDDDTLEGEITVKYHGQQARQQSRLHRADKTVFVSAEDMKRPKPGGILELDNKIYTVLSAKARGDMYEIDLQKAEGR